MRAADRLAGLAHRLVGDGAAVDDDRIVAGERAHRLALGEVEPAAEGDRLGASGERLQVDLALNTWVAGPRMRIGSPGAQPMVSAPPGMCTLTGDVAFFWTIAATAVAQAPVPQASVRPAPRSQVRRWMPSSRTEATLTLIRSGKAGSCSMLGPMLVEVDRVSSGTKKTTCGLPTLTAIGFSSCPQATGSWAVSIA